VAKQSPGRTDCIIFAPTAGSASVRRLALGRRRKNQLILRDIFADRNEETMRKLAFVIMLLSVSLFSAVAWAVDSNPAEYTINVHVSSSRVVESSLFNQELDVVIEGKRYELLATNASALLAPGDDKAKLVKDTHPNTYESFQVYEVLFPDKKIRKFSVVGVTK
jgi:hypothetical protein